ncbi:PaaX family transcriptional regulator [Nocardioides gansuensis]|uniref:PaaX family transcriptional regulator n=1 Tax=Nocardioides gansuensis TaxID=2138300 RepID=A0A2T8F7V5_9ACTN|nr:PaaX family transcriptional regulator C-terminal domain-containing protein [Nocardioides gansuensis]PVG81796.1 PaaX family transcriptional regulator [Nocardioides gansuensis]
MLARSALFDVYGDHLRDRDRRATVAGLVRLLETVGIAAPAVRTAVSRMVSQGWLEPVTVDGARGYAATTQAIRRLEDTSNRIYHLSSREWDGCWHLVLLEPFSHRTTRTAVHRGLSFLGFAELSDRVWVSAWESLGLEELLARAGARATTAVVTDFSPADAPLRAWDLPAIGAAYAEWLERQTTATRDQLNGDDDAERAAFAARFHLVHEFRKFLFTDPGLPAELLPADWPGTAAAEWFREESARLAPASRAFVARTMAGD